MKATLPDNGVLARSVDLDDVSRRDGRHQHENGRRLVSEDANSCRPANAPATTSKHGDRDHGRSSVPRRQPTTGRRRDPVPGIPRARSRSWVGVLCSSGSPCRGRH